MDFKKLKTNFTKIIKLHEAWGFEILVRITRNLYTDLKRMVIFYDFLFPANECDSSLFYYNGKTL